MDGWNVKCVIYLTGEGAVYKRSSANPYKEKVLAMTKYENPADLPPEIHSTCLLARFYLHSITYGNKSSLLLKKWGMRISIFGENWQGCAAGKLHSCQSTVSICPTLGGARRKYSHLRSNLFNTSIILAWPIVGIGHSRLLDGRTASFEPFGRTSYVVKTWLPYSHSICCLTKGKWLL